MSGENLPAFSLQAARALIRDLRRLRDERSNEAVMRQKLVAGLADMFPPAARPWWVERHLRGAEAHLRFATTDGVASGYADSIVGVTAIEYERDLRRSDLYTEGKYQVRQYCAGLLNAGADAAKVRGVLSDGVEWHAYELIEPPLKEPGQYSADDVLLRELERRDCDDDELSAGGLVRFLERYLGRPATRPVSAASIADYFGFGSGTATALIGSLRQAVEQALADDPPAAELLRTVWTSFMAYLGGSAAFDLDAYVRELYLASLAKVMCANVITRTSLRSGDGELDRILDGRYFADRGLQRLVEHDYFGWMNTRGETLRDLARVLQADFSAYDFDQAPADDLFGPLLAMLAEGEQRILLGQESTPRWLADQMVAALVDQLAEGEFPRFVDMCCGSGTMLVATTAQARALLANSGHQPGTQTYINALAGAATGFDIDPLAVMLSKVNWVATNRDALGSLDGSLSVAVPVYHADSLFALAPVFGENQQPDASGDYHVRMLSKIVKMPMFLAQPAHQMFFDALLDAAYRLAAPVSETPGHVLEASTAETAVVDAEHHPGPVLAEGERERTVVFLVSFVNVLVELIAAGQNGIWVFLVRNSYRPGLVAGQFNGIVTNPPWLAMSKIASNPFDTVLRERANAYGLAPRGSAFLHLEMATIFLVHAVDHYLASSGGFACVLPGTVRNGTQHQPFREQLTEPDNTQPIPMKITGLWSVAPGVFKNRAMVILGRKDTATRLDHIAGQEVSASYSDQADFHVVTRGQRLIWSTSDAWKGRIDPYPIGRFAQGADIMPRQLVFFKVQAVSGQRLRVRPIEPGDPEWFLVNLAKKQKTFRVSVRTLADRFAFPSLLSSHVAPFAIANPSVAVLPLAHVAGHYRLASPSELATTPGVKDHFNDIVSESDFTSLEDFWDRGLNYRSKLERQAWTSTRWLVVFGAGGGIPAAAYRKITSDDNLVIDQTLYWASFDSENEALYASGLLNSDALIALISDFIPEGEFGDRHLHTLPLSVLPAYDPANASHQRVAAATRAVTAELAALRQDKPEIDRLFTTAIEMKKRRRMVRNLLHGLASYGEYASSCEALLPNLTGGATGLLDDGQPLDRLPVPRRPEERRPFE